MTSFERMVQKYRIMYPGTEPEKAARAVMKQEAKNRMQIMRLHSRVVDDFMGKDILNRSEGKMGGLYRLTREEALMVKNWEEEYDCLVYHVLKSNFAEIGIIYSLFYVSRHADEWRTFRANLKNGYSFVYGLNVTNPILSEFGGIAVEYRFGGVVRTV